MTKKAPKAGAAKFKLELTALRADAWASPSNPNWRATPGPGNA